MALITTNTVILRHHESQGPEKGPQSVMTT